MKVDPSKTALVVDDEGTIRSLIVSVLSNRGFQTFAAASGQEALSVIRALKGHVDLVISDIQMPDGDGLWLKSTLQLEYPGLPCILMSGLGPPEAKKNILFIAKPFRVTELLQLVNRIAGCPTFR